MINTGDLSVRAVDGARARRDWLAVPQRVFADDPVWIRPLDKIELDRISPRHNPFFHFGEAALFLAYRGDTPVGRISAQVNRRHLDLHRDATGHFGFFDCVDDLEAATALFATARTWLKARGMTRLVGPCSFTINEDIGLLVAGFDTAPAVLCSHAKPHQGRLVEACGLRKSMDLFAYRVGSAAIPPKVERLASLTRDRGQLRVRSLDLAHYAREAAIIFDIFNDAWSDNWGFVPFSTAEIDKVISDTRPIMRGKFGRIIEVDGEPAAMILGLPDLNRVIAPFGGRLLPFNWLRLVDAVRRDQWTSARVPLMGVRKKYRRSPLAAGLLSIMAAEMLGLARTYNLDWIEFSWILETNGPMVQVAELAAGQPARVYRVYEGAI